MWDEDYLYILMYINVKPGTAEYENDHTTKVPWENNSLNFFINSDNTHAGNYKPDDFYWLMHPYGNIRSKNVSNNANASSVKVTEDGYVAEAKINIALLTANINPQAGEKFGFDASSNINLMSHGRNITLIWCSINSRLADSTREFGEVKLVMRPVPETDATESTYEEAGGETDVAPGDYNDSENYPGWDYDDYSEEPAATDVVNFGPALAIGILAVVLAGVALNIKRLVGLLIARKNKTGG
jgi:hypothetical protein